MNRSSRGPNARSRTSCDRCRRRHEKCSGHRPCQGCSAKKLQCTYATASFEVREWEPTGAGLPAASPTGPSIATSEVTGSFVSENQGLQSRYHVLPCQPWSTPEPSKAVRDSSPDQPLTDLWEHRVVQDSDEISICPPVKDSISAFFMERYCYIIGPWFDMFDASKQWSYTIPQLSLSHKSLFQSIIASCAKQYSLVSSESTIFALDYYNSALKELTRALGDSAMKASAATFASCLLTGYCEMIDARSLDWHTHLNGTFSLCSTQGWHGVCGGVAESCFWVYCRMDLLASIARSERTLRNPSLWLPPTVSLNSISISKGHQWRLDAWCNQVVLLLAQTHNLLCDVGSSQYDFSEAGPLGTRWNDLNTSVDSHEACRPVAFHPVIALPPSGFENPFQRLIYVSPVAAAATQMLDLAHFFLILAFPDPSPLSRRFRLQSHHSTYEALSLSRKIVANSISNRHAIAWVNAVQLLSTSGMVLVETDERVALVRVLEDIRTETGWNTHGSIESLKNWWDSAAVSDDPGSERMSGSGSDSDSDSTRQQVGKFLLKISNTYFVR